MRRNINKIVAFAIGISVMSGSIIPAFAADTTASSTTSTTTTSSTSTANVQAQTNQSNVLTLDDAIKSAISISDTLALDEQKIAYQDKTNDINKEKDEFNNVNDDVKKIMMMIMLILS